jgi:hypothetical protein
MMAGRRDENARASDFLFLWFGSMPDINKLKSSGYHTVQQVMARHPKHLRDIKGFSEAKADKVAMSFGQHWHDQT